MTWDIATLLTVSGLQISSIYLLTGLGLVLIFSVTRVIFVPFGDISVFAAITLAGFEAKQVPGTIPLVAAIVVFALVVEVTSRVRRREWRVIPKAVLYWGVLPLVPCGLAWLVGHFGAPAEVQIAASILLVVPVAPALARIALQPIADASVLVLLIVSLALEFVTSGVALLFFGPDGFRTQPLVPGSITLPGGIPLDMQVVLMICVAIIISGLFYLAFQKTTMGKALRATAVNRVGARLVGIRPARASTLAFLAASLLAGFIGVLISPVTTLYYDSGFLIGLKAFVAALIGGLVSYPGTAIGALFVGIFESFASFYSGALKDAIVFGLLIPILIIRSILIVTHEEDPEELDQ
ncbi:MAG TPA: branched-chain amino acid ABC transporter permease [Nevskiaceae bacterium]